MTKDLERAGKAPRDRGAEVYPGQVVVGPAEPAVRAPADEEVAASAVWPHPVVKAAVARAAQFLDQAAAVFLPSFVPW